MIVEKVQPQHSRIIACVVSYSSNSLFTSPCSLFTWISYFQSRFSSVQKREELDKATLEDEQDKDDERPTVVVLKSGDLTADEAEKLGVFGEKDEDDTEDSSGRVVFKKPTKRPLEASKESDEIRSKLEKRESSMKKVNNKTLLSFDDEEDDDPDSD
ncbi:unnamed protein product [Orchesella dallaii]|uniref:DUF4604 domain-containing protein n=1 Tax=Orchesella dallaii TaxID=48710 RepID=A0ABP1Q3Z9_9HEXA